MKRSAPLRRKTNFSRCTFSGKPDGDKRTMAATVQEGTAPKFGSGKCGGSTSATNSRFRRDVTARRDEQIQIHRKTPLRARKPIRRASKARRAELAIYAKLGPSWLQRVPFCEMPSTRFVNLGHTGWMGCLNRSTEIHHIKGRSGKLLNDTNHWLGVCRDCHRWIHDHPNAARKLGVLQF